MQHERGLAGAVGAEQGDPLAAVDVQVHPEQRLVAVGVGVGEAAYVEDGGAQVVPGVVRRAAVVAPARAAGGRRVPGVRLPV